jgi:hypothetical protein
MSYQTAALKSRRFYLAIERWGARANINSSVNSTSILTGTGNREDCPFIIETYVEGWAWRKKYEK